VWSIASQERMDDWMKTLKSNTTLLCSKASIRCLHSGGTLMQHNTTRSIMPRNKKRPSVGSGLTIGALVDNCPGEHATLQIRHIQRGEGGVIFIHVESHSNTVCLNVNRAHSQSEVFFRVQNGQLEQRCFCRKYGCCTYSGPKCHVLAVAMRRLGIGDGRIPPVFGRY